MAEIYKELVAITGERLPSAGELEVVKDKKTLTLPGRWETGHAIAQSIAKIVRFGFQDDHWTAYPGKIRALELGQVSAAAERVLRPEQLIWVVVGDREKIEDGVRELGFGEIHFLDEDGNDVR